MYPPGQPLGRDKCLLRRGEIRLLRNPQEYMRLGSQLLLLRCRRRIFRGAGESG